VHGEAGATTWSGAHAATLGGTDLDVAYAAARDRLRWWRRRVRLPAGDYEVLLSPSCTADLMLRLYRAAGARAALDGRTAFAAPGGTRLGERLTAAPVTLFSDPAAPGLRCAPFVVARGGGELSVYDNGLPLSRTHWITGGVLTALAGSRHTAAGDATTDDTTRDRATAAPEIGNLVLRSDAETPPSIADMVSGTRRGLLVTSLWYLREVDPRRLLLTGFTRDGVYLIEDGMIRGAAGDFRFNTSPLDVLARIREVGRTELALPREYGEHAVRAAMPWLRVENFTLSEAAGA
jgi:predicted Zn-dependent protease